jgi:hypothetical protein
MGRYITVSVKLPLEVNEKLGLKPSKLLRRYRGGVEEDRGERGEEGGGGDTGPVP